MYKYTNSNNIVKLFDKNSARRYPVRYITKYINKSPINGGLFGINRNSKFFKEG